MKITLPLGLSINNPCNIRYVASTKWLGSIGQRKGFVYFCQLFYGYRAFFLLCRTYFNKYSVRSIRVFLSRFAPTSENNTSAYCSYLVRFMCQHGFDSSFDLNCKRIYWLTVGVTLFEQGMFTSECQHALDKAFDCYSLEVLK